ncbi:U3 small nucleolar RNA-associated protein [Sodiomyces alkalinus F11]|uniref:U3 small nucleolar RNA-associated protein 11 n=1 Tax=Sodiomyces alkalinus (strain CBS 110278 / VKM F-3762 / F11) TaxID=1314773 RepID=A0A3N2PZC7_SODAK|nr:U3 small nucleolar RNA-associated protein [Sodiomyces alkalinus F11]ROT39705.1 U3 small nucleolar RNA-associated protein [Sodiomyces alkalinus F11]
MSSMRNAVQRRSHRERAQPLERQRLGLLEKDKDRKLRQKDYKKKQATLKALRAKADDRNEDEFYFGMASRQGPGSRLSQGKRWSGTVAGDRGNKALSTDAVRLLKTQDVGYVRTMRSVVVKEVTRLREQLVFASEGLPEVDDEEVDEEEGGFDFAAPLSGLARPKKIVFVDGEAEAALNGVGDREKEGEEEEFGGFDDSEGGDAEKDKGEDQKHDEMARRTRNLQRIRKELALAEKKLKVLTEAERELEVQKAKMAKTATSGGVTRKGKKIMVRARKK